MEQKPVCIGVTVSMTQKQATALTRLLGNLTSNDYGRLLPDDGEQEAVSALWDALEHVFKTEE